MTHTIQQMRETSPAFRHALLRSEKKRIVGVIVFVAFFSVLAIVRIYVLGSAMSRWGLVVSALVIAFELGLYRAVNESLHSGESISNFLWYGSSILECLFPAVGVAFLASTRLLPDYRPLATPWVLAFFPFILLSQADCHRMEHRRSEPRDTYPNIVCPWRKLENGVVAGGVGRHRMLVRGGGIFNAYLCADDECALRILHHARDTAGGLGLGRSTESKTQESTGDEDDRDTSATHL
jgi:hypothetical protein